MKTTRTIHVSPRLRVISFVLLIVYGYALPASADTVFFKHGTRLECKVDSLTPDGWKVVLGNEDKGAIILDPATIEKILYDYDSRFDTISQREEASGETLYKDHYDLGLWCEENAEYDRRMYDRALERLLYAQGHEGVPDDVHLHIARMFEKCRTPDLREADKAYKKHLALNPDSAEAAAAIKRLEPLVQKEAAQPTAPTETAKGEGLEVKPWRWERWSNPGTVQSVQEAASHSQVLEMKYKSKGKDKAAFSYPLTDKLSAKKSLLLDIFNPGKKPLRIGVAIVTGGNYEWFESKAASAKADDWTIGMRFDLTRANWKSKATNWMHRTKPGNLDNVRNMVILVYNGGTEGACYIDSIRFEDPE